MNTHSGNIIDHLTFRNIMPGYIHDVSRSWSSGNQFRIGTRSHAVDEADCCSHTRIKIASAAYMGQNFEKGER